jgi:hypothetical protein
MDAVYPPAQDIAKRRSRLPAGREGVSWRLRLRQGTIGRAVRLLSWGAHVRCATGQRVCGFRDSAQARGVSTGTAGYGRLCTPPSCNCCQLAAANHERES